MYFNVVSSLVMQHVVFNFQLHIVCVCDAYFLHFPEVQEKAHAIAQRNARTRKVPNPETVLQGNIF